MEPRVTKTLNQVGRMARSSSYPLFSQTARQTSLKPCALRHQSHLTTPSKKCSKMFQMPPSAAIKLTWLTLATRRQRVTILISSSHRQPSMEDKVTTALLSDQLRSRTCRKPIVTSKAKTLPRQICTRVPALCSLEVVYRRVQWEHRLLPVPSNR